MSLQSVSMLFFDSYEKDNSAIDDLCRTCLNKADDEYVSVHSALPWTQREVCTAQQLIQEILNRELIKKQPQPQRICSKCIKKMRIISTFRTQCMDSENILNEFHKHIEQQKVKAEQSKVEQTEVFNINDILTEEFADTFLTNFESVNIKREDDLPELEAISPILGRSNFQPRRPVTRSRTTKKPPKAKKSNDAKDIDTHINEMLDKDNITASLKSLEKKYKKEQTGEGGLCEQCGLTFTNSHEYKKHIRSHDDKTKQTFKFHCKFCSKGFNHKQTYNIHTNSHTREIKFICDMCGKSLATKNSLRIHFRYHLGIKNHACEKCGYRFVTPREMRDHLEKKHAASRAIACTYSDCTETFDSEYRLNLHLRVHETNYAFRCDICGVATVSKFRLSVHKKIHTGEMIRQCSICNKSLAHDNALRRHLRNVHGQKNPKPIASKMAKATKSIAMKKTKETNMESQSKKPPTELIVEPTEHKALSELKETTELIEMPVQIGTMELVEPADINGTFATTELIQMTESAELIQPTDNELQLNNVQEVQTITILPKTIQIIWKVD